MSRATPPDEQLLQWVECYCNGTISDENFERLQQRLRSDADARTFYLRYMGVHCALGDYGDNVGRVWQTPFAEQSPSARESRWSLKAKIFAITAAIVIAIISTILLATRASRNQPSNVIARLEQTRGAVTIIGADAESRAASSGAPIRSGDTIRTETSASSALLVFPDSTRLSLVGNTSITCTNSGQPRVIVHGGTLFATVAPQRNGNPMLLATPKNRVQVLGTKFLLTATSNETQIVVDEGSVRLTRLSDGKSVDVPAGRLVISSTDSDLSLQKIVGPLATWSEDFEHGLPKRWELGRFVFTNSPTGSKGGVEAVRRRDAQREYFQIATPADWIQGLFAAHKDSHLHFTCKMRDPGQVNIFLLTRTKGDSPTFASNYLFDREGWWPPAPDQWCTVTIPLSEFRRLAPGRVPIQKVIPFQLLFSSPITDRGLVIDRIWVSRGGPNVVKTKLLN